MRFASIDNVTRAVVFRAQSYLTVLGSRRIITLKIGMAKIQEGYWVIACLLDESLKRFRY